MGLLATAAAFATIRSPVGLQCTAVRTWACAEAKTCERRDGDAKESYSFDLVAKTYQAPHDRGAITAFETDDDGFMTFLSSGGPRYVHKNVDAGDPMTSFLYMSSMDMRELRCNARYAPDASAVGSSSPPRDHVADTLHPEAVSSASDGRRRGRQRIGGIASHSPIRA